MFIIRKKYLEVHLNKSLMVDNEVSSLWYFLNSAESKSNIDKFAHNRKMSFKNVDFVHSSYCLNKIFGNLLKCSK